MAIHPGKKRANLRDVAKAANVSVATVSRVLNTPSIVSEQTRNRVLTAIDKLHFVPSAAARAINSGRTNIVGALVPTLDNAIFARFLGVLEERLVDHGLSLVVATTHGDVDVEAKKASSLVDAGAEGLIVSGVTHTTDFDELVQRSRLPAIATSYFDEDYYLPTIGYDNAEASAAALDYLQSTGHRDIAIIHGPIETNDRTRARLRGLEDARSDLRLRYFPADLTMEGGIGAVRDFLSSGHVCTALLCLSDVLAMSSLFELQRQGINVPGSLSVMGMDDLPVSAFTVPSITSVHLPVGKMGQKTADAIALWIEDQTVPKSILLGSALVTRGSTGEITQHP